MRRKGKFAIKKLINLKVILLILFVLFLFFALTYSFWLRTIGGFLIVEDKVEKADLIVVLGGKAFERASHAAELFKSGFSKRVLVSGELVPDEIRAVGLSLTEAELSRNVLVSKGVPKKLIILMNKGTSTFEEAQAIKDLMTRRNYKSAIIVTSPFHSRRAILTFRFVFRGKDVKLMMSPSKEKNLALKNWWTREEDLIDLNNEYIKLGLYFFKYFIHL